MTQKNSIDIKGRARMIKKFIEEQLNIDNPTKYIYKLTVCRNELNDLITKFEREWTWCAGCQGYEKNETAKMIVEDGRTILRCGKCNSVLKFLD
jgi:ribonuclease HI